MIDVEMVGLVVVCVIGVVVWLGVVDDDVF